MLKNILAKLGFRKTNSSLTERAPTQSEIPIEDAGRRLMVSTQMVKELIEIQKSRGVKSDPRAHMIGTHLYQLGGAGSLTVAKNSFAQEFGSAKLIELEDAWKGVANSPRDPNAAREIVALEMAGMITDAMFKE
jgi:hypothetical protein